jgi:hypothetical protein
MQLLSQLQSLTAIASFTHDAQIVLGLEDHAEAFPNHGVIVSQKDADHDPVSAKNPVSSSPIMAK